MLHRLLGGLLGAAIALGCGGTQTTQTARPRQPDPPAPSPRTEAVVGPRDLPADATFADLVRVVELQDRHRDSDSAAGCLLADLPAGFRVAADLAVAVRPLPEVAEDLDVRLERAPGAARVLTRYGSYGSSGLLGATALTTTMPPREAVATVLVLTDRGVYTRTTDGPSTAAGVAPRSAIGSLVAGATTVFVTAEAGVPLRELRAALAALPSTLVGHVGLALLLTEDTRLPDSPALEPGEDSPVCADGLPPLAEDAPLGDLAPARLLAGIAPLRTAGEICVGTSEGTGARGGRVVLDVRVAADGRVGAACVREDETGDSVLRACLVRATEALVFDAPGGALDFELPLVLAPGVSHRQRALCD